MMRGMRAWAVLLVFVTLAFLIEPARADEQRTFYGKTVDGWIAVLRDKTSSDQKRLQAVWALGCLGPEAKTAEKDLIEMVHEKQLKDAAIGALARIRADDDVIVPILIDQFIKHGCQHLTGQGTFLGFGASADQLVRVGRPAVPALINVLNGPNWDMRVCAAEALSRIGPAAEAAVPSLVRAIEQPDPQHDADTLNVYVVRALGGIGPNAMAAIPTLNKLLEKNNRIDFDVVKALERIGVPPVRRIVEAFLRDGGSDIAHQLGWLGPRAREATPVLRTALADNRLQFRFSAADALVYIDSSAADAVPVLIESLNYLNDQEIDANGAPAALAHLGPKAKAALPALIGLVQKGCEDTDVLKALVKVDPEAVACVPALISALKRDDYEVADVAARCLGLLGSSAKVAVPALADTVTREFSHEDSSSRLPRVSAAKALQRIGTPAIAAVPKLVIALKYRRKVPMPFDGREGDREELDFSAAAAAAEAIGSFGPKAKSAVPYLIEAVETKEKDDENWPVRQAAILALGRIGPDAIVAIPALRDAMKDLAKRLQGSTEVLIALYQLDPEGKHLAESWLENFRAPAYQDLDSRLKARAMLLGAMGRTSLETDWLTSRYLERMDSMFGSIDPRYEESIEFIEEWLETLGSFGTAGRLAIPRMIELRKHSNPWVRMWAAETLEKLTAPARPATAAKQN